MSAAYGAPPSALVDGAAAVKSERKVIIIAGPNGAGKTTFAREFLPHEADCPMFVNADLIAAGLAPFAPASAALLSRQHCQAAIMSAAFSAGRQTAIASN